MKVEDLIEKLQEFDPQADVVYYDQYWVKWIDVENIEQDTESVPFENRKQNVVYIL